VASEHRAKIQAVLFACAMNAIRSPMAEAIARHYFGKTHFIQSAGIRKGDIDGFTIAVLAEIGIDAKTTSLIRLRNSRNGRDSISI